MSSAERLQQYIFFSVCIKFHNTLQKWHDYWKLQTKQMERQVLWHFTLLAKNHNSHKCKTKYLLIDVNYLYTIWIQMGGKRNKMNERNKQKTTVGNGVGVDMRLPVVWQNDAAHRYGRYTVAKKKRRAQSPAEKWIIVMVGKKVVILLKIECILNGSRRRTRLLKCAPNSSICMICG